MQLRLVMYLRLLFAIYILLRIAIKTVKCREPNCASVLTFKVVVLIISMSSIKACPSTYN